MKTQDKSPLAKTERSYASDVGLTAIAYSPIERVYDSKQGLTVDFSPSAVRLTEGKQSVCVLPSELEAVLDVLEQCLMANEGRLSREKRHRKTKAEFEVDWEEGMRDQKEYGYDVRMVMRGTQQDQIAGTLGTGDRVCLIRSDGRRVVARGKRCDELARGDE